MGVRRPPYQCPRGRHTQKKNDESLAIVVLTESNRVHTRHTDEHHHGGMVRHVNGYYEMGVHNAQIKYDWI